MLHRNIQLYTTKIRPQCTLQNPITLSKSICTHFKRHKEDTDQREIKKLLNIN